VNRAYFPGLTAKPWWDVGDLPVARKLEVQAQDLLHEYRSLRAQSVNDRGFGQTRYVGYQVDQLMASGAQTPAFEDPRNAPLSRLLVDTCLNDCPRSVMVSRQEPGTGLPEHSDELNFVLTMHLGMEIPASQEVWIEVAGERRTWDEGKILVFDSSFQHHTVNEGKSAREILLIDFWHPELTEAEKEGISWLYRFRSEWLARSLASPWEITKKLRPLSRPKQFDRKSEKIYYDVSPAPPISVSRSRGSTLRQKMASTA